MEYKNYEIFMIAVPLNDADFQEDVYNLIGRHCKTDPPIFAMGVELSDNETTLDLTMKMRRMLESEGGKFVDGV